MLPAPPSPVHGAASVCINLHEQLPDLLQREVAPQVGTQLLTELIYVKLPAAILIGILCVQVGCLRVLQRAGTLCTAHVAHVKDLFQHLQLVHIDFLVDTCRQQGVCRP